MVDVVQTAPSTTVIDPACGTGGFLIAALQRCHDNSKLTYQQSIQLVRDKLIGYESEPITAALCIANMIVRGDGKTGIRKDNCFKAKDYPNADCDVALMNPPFPHKKTDTPPQQFIERALEALKAHGRLGVIVPTSFVVKKEYQSWRKQILKANTLTAVVQLPDELFQPFSSTTTSIIFIERGVPHDPKRKTAFVRIEFDGLTLKKGIRVQRTDGKNQLEAAVDAIHNKTASPGFSGITGVIAGNEWSPGAYIKSAVPNKDELKESIDVLLRRLISFYVRYAKEVSVLRERVANGELKENNYRLIAGKARLKNAEKLPSSSGTVGEIFDILYGQKELHSREGYAPGDGVNPSDCTPKS
jgi:type I restriction-modification system DNA methylase subunit